MKKKTIALVGVQLFMCCLNLGTFYLIYLDGFQIHDIFIMILVCCSFVYNFGDGASIMSIELEQRRYVEDNIKNILKGQPTTWEDQGHPYYFYKYVVSLPEKTKRECFNAIINLVSERVKKNEYREPDMYGIAENMNDNERNFMKALLSWPRVAQIAETSQTIVDSTPLHEAMLHYSLHVWNPLHPNITEAEKECYKIRKLIPRYLTITKI